jgi:cell division transport system permease protein
MRIFVYAFRNIWRNPFLSFSTLLVLVLVTFFASILLLVEHTTDVLIGRVSERLSLSVYLKKEIVQESSQLQIFMRELHTIDPSIEVQYQSSETALSDFQERYPGLTSIVESKDDNILPGKVFVQIKSDRQVKSLPAIYDEINSVVEKNQSILLYNDQDSLHKSLVDYRSQYESVARLVNIFEMISRGAFAILILVIFSATAMIYSSIGNMVFYSREEVNIIGLVGGSNYYLYTPFILQSVIYILLAFGISSALFFATLQALSLSILA